MPDLGKETQPTSQMDAPDKGTPMRGRQGLFPGRAFPLAHSNTCIPTGCGRWLSCVSEVPDFLGFSPSPKAEPQERFHSPWVPVWESYLVRAFRAAGHESASSMGQATPAKATLS